MTDQKIEVREYGDLAARTDLSRTLIDKLVTALNEADGSVLVLREWLVEKKDIEPMREFERCYRVSLLSESDDGWEVAAGGKTEWVPKSQSLLLERAAGCDEISSPSKTLTDFAGGGGA